MHADGRLALSALVLALALPASGCTAVTAPVARPAQTPPPVLPDDSPIPEDHGRVVLDVVDGPTSVYRVMDVQYVRTNDKGDSYTFWRTEQELLCTTPCVVDLPNGERRLGFPFRGDPHPLELDLVQVDGGTIVYRRALGQYDSAGGGLALGIVGTTFGAMAAIVGLVFLPLGLSEDSDGMTLAGAITLGVGGGLMGFGILGIALSPSVRTPGASLVFRLP